jgi:general secretion pathway protein M
MATRLARFKPRVPDRWREQFDVFWTARNPREQAILGGGAVVLVLVFGYLLLWEPASVEEPG